MFINLPYTIPTTRLMKSNHQPLHIWAPLQKKSYLCIVYKSLLQKPMFLELSSQLLTVLQPIEVFLPITSMNSPQRLDHQL